MRLDPTRTKAVVTSATAVLASLLLPGGEDGLHAQVLYWSSVNDGPDHVIRRGGPDGSGTEDVVKGIADDILGVAVDAGAGLLYWIERGPTESRIVRSDLDGAGREVLHPTGDSLSRIALDAPRGMVYFTFSSSGSTPRYGIGRFDISGGLAEDVVPTEPDDLAVDSAGGRIYWVAEGRPGIGGAEIWWAALDGSDPLPIIHHPFDHHTTGIALDPAGGKIYWATTDYRSGNVQIVQRANLDGSGIEDVTSANPGLDDWPVFLALDPGEREVYWVNGEDGVFYRAAFDGGDAEELHEDSGPYGPFGLAILLSPEGPPVFRRGDANGDGSVDIGDPVAILSDLFLGTGLIPCAKAADGDDDGKEDITDVVFILGYLFIGGDAPPEPSAGCGTDPTTDSLRCEGQEACRSR